MGKNLEIMTKAVILAAGVGSRFNSPKPKSLSQLNVTTTVLNHQIKCLSSRIGLENIWIVVGYKKNIIQKKFPKLNFVHNPKYLSTNTSKSLLLALEKIDDDVLCLAGDIYFDEEVLDLILSSNHSACIVDKKECGNEEMKYDLSDNGFIRKLSKVLKYPEGEAIGIDLIKKDDLDLFREELKFLDDKDYFSKGLENLIRQKKLKLLPIYIGNLFCMEFDYPHEFEKIKQFLKRNH